MRRSKTHLQRAIRRTERKATGSDGYHSNGRRGQPVRCSARAGKMAESSGLEKLDSGALSPEQQEKLRQFKIKTRIANEKYLSAHPELELLLSEFLRDIFFKRPVDIREFAADYFTDANLPKKILAKVEDNNS
ncbi:RIIa domain-containing protein 1 [Scleropages formosus]|uniref:Regulatory subunit of type II PKA R-subunit domain containing 1 n=2 Tax=Scleropages formosus TaxID=113540 RepID=A0A8C9W9E5_SCLFO|nr:RIIa domain-containing protein 1 [Scleropages formosus]